MIGRLLNSVALLEGTRLVLLTVKESFPKLWDKNKSQREEIMTLMQGISLPTPFISLKIRYHGLKL